MDRSLGTNLHLGRFFTHAKRTARREFIYICSVPPPVYSVGHVYTLFLLSFNIVWGEGGKATHFETENSAFLRLRFKHTEN